MKQLIMSVLLAGAAWISVSAADPACFLKDGDLWVFHGDSITHADTYRHLCEQVFRHYHPDAKVTFLQAGVWGSSSSETVAQLKAEGRKPTVVSLMTGMNNAINGQWAKGLPRDKALEGYRKDLTTFVRKNKEAGAAVVLMSPTLTDETCRRTFFRIEGTVPFLKDCGTIAREVAQAEGAFFVPVQEEFEAFQETLGAHQRLRPDGVHPASWGEYRIALSLCGWMHMEGALAAGERALSAPVARLPVDLVAVERRLEESAQSVPFRLDPGTNAFSKVTLAWSLGAARGEETLSVTGPTEWTWAPKGGLAAPGAGLATSLLVNVRSGSGYALFVVDLADVPVLAMVSNKVGGSIESAADRPEGKRVADWTLERAGAELLLEAEVVDDRIESSSEWAYARDGLTLFLDFRPADRFGGINFDDDVHQAMVNVYEKPFFATVFRPWLGAGLDNAVVAGGEKTEKGYKVRLRFGDRLNLKEPLAVDKRAWLGLALGVTDADPGEGGKVKVTMHEAIAPARARDQFADGLALIDLTGTWKGSRAVQVNVFP